LPVIKNGSRSQQVDLCIRNSKLWKYFRIFHLTKNMRAGSGEQEFARFIRRVGMGKTNTDDGYCQLPAEYCTNESIACEIFGPIFKWSTGM
jgi:hypothetical protein